MQKKYYIFLFCLPFCCFSQIVEDFSDGDFTNNPEWTGSSETFKVNANLQLQSSVNKASKSFLFTPSEAFDNASWEVWLKINCPVTTYNYARIYLTSDRIDSIVNSNAYYLQIGGKNKNISLYCQQRGKKTAQAILTGEKNRLDFDSVELKIKVLRNKQGGFEVYSKLFDEDDFLLEGEVENNKLQQANYFGLMFANTNNTGDAYFFDSIRVSGSKAVDTIRPILETWEIENKNILHLNFSKRMDFSEAAFSISNFNGLLLSQNPSSDFSSILLKFSEDFDVGIIYRLFIERIHDTSGNELAQDGLEFALTEAPEKGDIVINELLFEVEPGEYEYIELFNNSNKIFDVSEIYFANRKADLKLSSLVSVEKKELFAPYSYLAVSENAAAVCQRYACPEGSKIASTKSWNNLSDESGTLVITNKEKTVFFDELSYQRKWHQPLLIYTKGVALERISPLLPTQYADSWHSAASTAGYGTPGYRNSQFRDASASVLEKTTLRIDPESFSPDNDGNNDICFIHYKTEEPGYLANVTIFNAGGIKIIQLASNTLLESEGAFIWDGKNDLGQLVNTGIYVLCFEMFHPQKAKKKLFKRAIVLSAR